MTLHTETLSEPTTGRYCSICEETWHEPYTHLSEPTTGRYCSICEETWHEPYTHLSGPFWHVPASNGAYYLVRGTACGCPSFYFGRRPCKHITHVRQLEVQGLKHDLPNVTWARYEQIRWPEDPTIDDIRGFLG